ncbi:MAG: dicarboxylate/amino acid:cation symporter [Sphaerochaetaceae bacterium]|nr:dicarboxylate/amino acid:cation symporter [Sphaerochaetaceae bacterium]
MKKFFERKNLFLRVFAGFVLGIILGLLAPGFSVDTKVVGDLYLNLIKLMVIPVVVCSVFCGITSIKDTSRLRQIGFKTVFLFVIMFVVSSFISLGVAFLINPGKGLSHEGLAFTGELASLSLSSFLLQVVPTNIFSALSSGSTIGVILFTVLFAVSVVAIGEKGKVLVTFMQSLSSALFKMLSYIMELSPLGVMSLMAYSVARYGAGLFSSLAGYILCCYLSCILVFIFVMVIPVCLYTKVSPLRLLRACGKIALVTMSTTSSAATLPTTIRVSVEDLGAPKSISEFILPLGCTINMCGGACSFCCLAVFTANVYSLDLSFTTILLMVGAATLINMAAPGIPGGGIVLGASFLSIFGLPFDIMGLISGFYRLLDMAFTTINVEGDVAANLMISRNVGMYSGKEEGK